jgi:hypothetical protein
VNRSASRDHLYLGKTAGTGRTHNNVLTCWEVNMGFTVRSPIPSNFNDVDSWKEAVTPCCHCTAFQGDRPLKKKLLKFTSHHDDGLAEPYRCQSLWSVHSGANPKQNSQLPSTLDTVLDVGLSEENPITSNKKKKRAPSDASAIKERVLPYHQPNTPINQVATGVTQADIDNLETKLLASYEYRLSQYKEEIATLQVQLASEKAYSSDRGKLELQNASLLEENRSLAQANSTLLAEVLEEKRRIRKQVLALASSQTRASSSTFVSNLEDCTKQQMSRGVNRKYLAEKLADVVREEAYGGLCGEYLSSSYCVEIQATNPYRNAMEVARVMDLGSGQLNISGLKLLRKGIEGDDNGRVKYGGGWLTTKYYLQQANPKSMQQLSSSFRSRKFLHLIWMVFPSIIQKCLSSSLKCYSWTILPEILCSHQFNLPVLLMEQTFPTLSLMSLLESRYWIPVR